MSPEPVTPSADEPTADDVAFARVCLSRRRVTRAQVEVCLEERREAARTGERLTLAQVMIRRGLVTAEQYARVLEQLRGQPGEDVAAASSGSYRLPPVLGPEPTSVEDLTDRAPRITTSGRYVKQPEPEPGSAELTVSMDGRQVLALPPLSTTPPPPVAEVVTSPEPGRVVDEPTDADDVPGVDAALRRALGAPAGKGPFRCGGYEVLELLAAGGMGAVYRARSDETGQIVALKMLLRGEDATDDQLRRFVVEARSGMAITHPGIITVHDIGVVENVAYFAMELIEGADLQSHLARGTFDRGALLEIIAAVADAVHVTHEHGVIHRDLKPANVIVRERDRAPILTDFGLAKVVDEGGRTTAGAVIGTPLFLSPEQVRGEEVDRRCDVYALGVMLYMAMAGRPPLVASDRQALYQKILREPVPPPSQWAPGLDPAVDAVCLRALAKRRDERHATARALAEDLRRVLRGEPVAPAPAPAPASPLPAPAAAAALALPSVPDDVLLTEEVALSATRRSLVPLVVIVLGGLALVVVLALVAIVVLRGR